MAQQRATLSELPAALIEALQNTLAVVPADDGQRTAQREIISALETALEARRQRIVISQSTVSSVKWAGLLLQALCALIAIAMVHSDNRITCRIALVLFAPGIRTFGLADCCLQSTVHRRNLSRARTPQAGRRTPSVGHPVSEVRFWHIPEVTPAAKDGRFQPQSGLSHAIHWRVQEFTD